LTLVAAACHPGTLDVALLVKDADVTTQLTNPLGVATLSRLLEPFLLVLLVGAAVGAAALLLRFRRSRGIERQQLKWVAYAALLFGIQQGGLALGRIAGLVPDTGLAWLEVVTNFTFGFFLVAIAVAVLRYRLYEIDRLINRTLAVAALFQPARRRIQHVVDRRFNRHKYNAAKTIEAFNARLRDEVDLDTLSAELLVVVDQTMQPTRVSLWLRPGPSLQGQPR
jgi:hypothetical protein